MYQGFRLQIKSIVAMCCFRRAMLRSARTATCWATVISYLIVALGIQIPLPAVKKAGQPYPCMNRPCGCASAEQCWRHCCCTTLEQRLAWARENHVTPPDYALAEARARGIDWESYCRVGPEHSARICQDGEEVAAKGCRHSQGEHPCGDAKHNAAAGIVWMQALACKGVNQNWMGLSVSLPPPAVVCLFQPADAAEHAEFPWLRLPSISHAPSTPPPRAISA